MKKLLLLLCILSSSLFASIGSITSFKGSVNVQRDAQTLLGKINLQIEKQDVISTRDNSNVIIKFNDGTIITIGKNSSLNIKEYVYDDKNKKQSKTNFQFLKGSFKTVTGIIGKANPSKFKLQTKTANLGIRGTVALGNQKLVAVTHGSVNVSTNKRSTIVNAGEYVDTVDKKISTAKKLTPEILSMLNAELGLSTNTEGSSSLESVTQVIEQSQSESNKSDDGGHGDSGGGDH